MKISYRTHPILRKLEEGKLGTLACVSDRDIQKANAMMPTTKQLWERNSKLFNKDIKIISRGFYDAYELSKDKLLKDDLLVEPLNGNPSGTFILGDAVICYFIGDVELDGSIYYQVCVWDFLKFGEALVIRSIQFVLLDKVTLLPVKRNIPLYYSYSDNKVPDHFDIQHGIPFTPDVHKQIMEYSTTQALNLLTLLNFIKFCPIEVKYLPAHQKVKGVDCKYINETKSNVHFIDSTWFTTLVKSDGFDVRGHFRLQPKKIDGEWTKEMIWINPFHKEGYTRKAGKLIHEAPLN